MTQFEPVTLGDPELDRLAGKVLDERRARAARGRAASAAKAAPSPRFPLVPFADLRPGGEPAYLVKGLIPRVGLTVVWGPPKCGKSFWTFDLAMHVALAEPYRGRRVHGGAVVYCAFEGAEGFKARAEAFRAKHQLASDEPVPFYLAPSQIDLVADRAALIVSIRAHLGDDAPVLVVLDTLNRSLRGSESDDKDMSAYIRAADAIRDAFNCAVVIVHHCGIDATRPRGHTALAGAVDAQIAVKRDAADNVVVTVEKMKDGPEGDTIVSALPQVVVGTDVDGDVVTSCIVVPVETSRTAAPSRKLSDNQRLALKALSEAVLEHGRPASLSLELPDGIRVVETDRFRDELFRSGVLDRTDSNPRQQFKRLRQALAARNLIGERDGLVWKAT